MEQERRVERFSLAERLGHWTHALTFVGLLITGSGLVFYGVGRLLGAGGLDIFRHIHRGLAYPFTFLTVAILFIGARRETLQWLKESTRWTREDIAFLQGFAREFFVLPAKLPPQGKYNAGQKLNSLITIGGSVLMVITGWMMVFADSFSLNALAWTHGLHAAGALTLGGVVLGHLYLGLFHPNSRASISGMIDGKVPARFAASHHANWYNNLRT